MRDSAVLVERDKDIVVFTLHHPAERSAVDGPTATALRESFEPFAADDSLKVAVAYGQLGEDAAQTLIAEGSGGFPVVADEAIPGARRFE